MIRNFDDGFYDDGLWDYVVVNVFGSGTGVGLVDGAVDPVTLIDIGTPQVELVEV